VDKALLLRKHYFDFMLLTHLHRRLTWKWKLLILLLLFLSGDYIRRRDFIEEERYVKYKTYENVINTIPENYTLHGIDISRYNGEVFWKKLAQVEIDSHKISFCFIKATEAMFFRDKEFLDNWHSAQKYHLIRGAYHFFRPSYNPKLQAWNYILNVRLQKGDLAPVLDIEVDEGFSDMELSKMCKSWLNIIERHYGIRPIIYTNIKFYNRVVKGKLEEYPLWIANYRQAQPQLPIQTKWHFWQHSDKGRLFGINEFVDLNVFNGDSTDLKNSVILR
jgi:lysozyme